LVDRVASDDGSRKKEVQMQLRFEVDRAEAFRRGVDVDEAVVTIEIDPKALPQEERDLIADHLKGIDVCECYVVNGERGHESSDGQTSLLKAVGVDYGALIEAIRQDERRFLASLSDQDDWQIENSFKS
jgi:hypothetical protein